jgi:branched-chain amino acid transport system substrate-binding protein
MMMRKVSIIAVVGIFFIVGLFYWGFAAPAKEAPKTIKVGSSCSLTGPFGSGGAMCKAGYEIAIEDINKKGGVFVKEFNKKIPLELILLDDASDFTQAVSRMETLYSTYDVVAYLGGFSSPMHATQAPIAEKNKVPLLMVGSYLYSIHQKGYKYNFSPFPKSPDCAKAVFDILDSIPPDQKPKKVAIFMEKAPVGMELGDMWKDESVKHGFGEPLYKEQPRGMKDFSPLIMEAKSAGCEILLAGPTTPEGITMTKQMKELDYSPKFYFEYRAPDPMAWGQALGKDGDYVVLGPGWTSGLKYPGVKELNKAHMKKFGRPADVMVGPAYACVQILANAIERAGTLDRDKVRDAIASTNMSTVIGPLKFRPDGTGEVIYFGVQWQKGKQEIIWPKEYATAPLVYPMPKWSER